MSLIYKKIPEIMKEVGAIEKNRSGQGIQYKFRGIDDIYLALQPLLSKHGVFYTPNVIEKIREERATKTGGIMTYTILTVEYSFFAEDGSNVKMVTIGEAMDSSDKSSNKAMSAALKYAMLQLFCIPTEEEKDTEYQNHQIVHKQAPREMPKANDSQDPGSYVISMGKKFKGMRLDQCERRELLDFSAWLGAQTDLKGVGKETKTAIDYYLEQTTFID